MQKIKKIKSDLKKKSISSNEKYPIGCWLDSARGIYIGQSVQEYAKEMGWTGQYEDIDSEFFSEAWNEAEQYLNSLPDLPADVYFGSNENGDWGLWNDDENDIMETDENQLNMFSKRNKKIKNSLTKKSYEDELNEYEELLENYINGNRKDFLMKVRKMKPYQIVTLLEEANNTYQTEVENIRRFIQNNK